METLTAIYILFVGAILAVLLALLAVGALRACRHRSRDAVLRGRYLHIVMMALMAGDGSTPRFPMIRRMGARLLLAETLAGVVGVTYGLDARPLRRIVEDNNLDTWLLHRVRRAQGYRRARLLSLLAALPAGGDVAAEAGRYLRSRNRYVRFYALMTQLAAEPSTALRLMAEYPHPFSACEVAEIMAVLRRGMLPIAYEPLVLSSNRNLRKVGLNIVRQFGVEEAEECVLRVVSRDAGGELGYEALYTLCALRRPLARREVADCIATMKPARRRALLRFMAQEGYAPRALQKLLDEREKPYYESLVQSYKRCLA